MCQRWPNRTSQQCRGGARIVIVNFPCLQRGILSTSVARPCILREKTLNKANLFSSLFWGVCVCGGGSYYCQTNMLKKDKWRCTRQGNMAPTQSGWQGGPLKRVQQTPRQPPPIQKGQGSKQTPDNNRKQGKSADDNLQHVKKDLELTKYKYKQEYMFKGLQLYIVTAIAQELHWRWQMQTS